MIKKDAWVPVYDVQGFGLAGPEWIEKMRTEGRNKLVVSGVHPKNCTSEN
jgi:hypothetical protein